MASLAERVRGPKGEYGMRVSDRLIPDEVVNVKGVVSAGPPAALRTSLPEMIRICAKTIDAASGEYGEAIEQGNI